MERLIRILIARLVSKGMELTCIPAFIRNLANILAANPTMGREELSTHLHSLGWGDFELDEHTLHLSIAVFESNLENTDTYWPPQAPQLILVREQSEDKDLVLRLG
jgi:hypothetical protein